MIKLILFYWYHIGIIFYRYHINVYFLSEFFYPFNIKILLRSWKLPTYFLSIVFFYYFVVGRALLARHERLSLRVSRQWHELPDARASKLDLLVPRSSRIARNSSYFVLIRKFVPVQPSSFTLCLLILTLLIPHLNFGLRFWFFLHI